MFPVDSLERGSVTISGKGAKRALFTVNGLPAVAIFDAMPVAFEPSAFLRPKLSRNEESEGSLSVGRVDGLVSLVGGFEGVPKWFLVFPL